MADGGLRGSMNVCRHNQNQWLCVLEKLNDCVPAYLSV